MNPLRIDSPNVAHAPADRSSGTTASPAVDRFVGVMSLLLTPFAPGGEIDWPVYDRYVDWQLAHGPQGLFAVCGTSEMKWLRLDERLELAKRAARRAGERPVLATANLEADIGGHADEVRQMAATGVSGIVLVPPPGLGADQGRLGDYFARLADAAGCPVFLYEWPQVTPHRVEPETFGRLAAQHGVRGIKDTTCTPEGIGAKIAAAPGAIVYQANTAFLPEAIALGAKGSMTITSACSGLPVEYWRRATGEDPEAARHLHARLVFLDALIKQAHPLAAKYLVRKAGIPIALTSRWPTDLAAELRRALDAWFDQADQADQIVAAM